MFRKPLTAFGIKCTVATLIIGGAISIVYSIVADIANLFGVGW